MSEQKAGFSGADRTTDPLTVRVVTAVRLTGLSRSRLYELIQSGELATVKIGRTTLIPFKSLRSLVGDL